MARKKKDLPIEPDTVAEGLDELHRLTSPEHRAKLKADDWFAYLGQIDEIAYDLQDRWHDRRAETADAIAA